MLYVFERLKDLSCSRAGLKDYDTQRDKRFSGSVRLPHVPRAKAKVCLLPPLSLCRLDCSLANSRCSEILRVRIADRARLVQGREARDVWCLFGAFRFV